MWARLRDRLPDIVEAFVVGIAYSIGVSIIMAVLMFCMRSFAHADTSIPRAALQYRSEMIRASRMVWGMDAPVAVFAAQIHTESWWNNRDVSGVGAQGLAQFMPETARWLPRVAPETGTPAPFDPRWSLRACVTYDKYLFDRMFPFLRPSLSEWNRMAFALSAYNGGSGWTNRDRSHAVRMGLNPDIWFGNVENANAGRNAAAKKENRNYVQLILRERQERYVIAGWGRGIKE